MRRRQQFLGRYLPGDGWLHRTPAGAKFAGLAVLSLVVLLVRSPGVSLTALGLVVLLGASARIPLRELVSPVRRVWLIIAFIVVFHLVFSDLWSALRVVSTILACILAGQPVKPQYYITALDSPRNALHCPPVPVRLTRRACNFSTPTWTSALPWTSTVSSSPASSSTARTRSSSSACGTTPSAVRHHVVCHTSPTVANPRQIGRAHV